MGQKYAAYDSTSGAITAFYDSVDSPVPQSVTSYIEITETEWQTCLNTRGYTVVKGALTAPPTPTTAELLAEAQSSQIYSITTSCATSIVSGFTSSALGSVHTYPSQQTDQLNLASSVTSSLIALQSPTWTGSTNVVLNQVVTSGGQAYICTTAGKTGSSAPVWPTTAGTSVTDGTAQWQIWTTLFWCADSSNNWNYAAHTAGQIQQAGVDGKAYIMSQISKKASLVAQINAATTVSAVQAIVW